MLKHLLAAAAFAGCIALPADAQDVAPPPVETMTCDQMTAEMTTAGQTMSSQLDPEFAREAQAMHDEAQGASRTPNIAAGIGASIACSLPGVAMACMAGQQARAAEAQREADRNNARMDAQMDRLTSSMDGLDQQRLMEMTQRYQQMDCRAPQ